MIRNYTTRGWNTFAGWKAFRAAHGYLPTQAMTEVAYRHNQQGSTGSVFRSNDGIIKVECEYAHQQVYVMSNDPGYLALAAHQNGVIDPAKSRCLSKARDMKVNVAVAFGEGRQTVRMLRETAEKLGKAYSAFRKGNFKKVAKVLGVKKPAGEAANHWLAWSYGWSPLLSDVVGAAELAAQHLALGGRGPRISVRGRNSNGLAVNRIAVTNQGSNWTVKGDYRIRGEWKYEAHAGLYLEMNYSSAALAAQTGFGLTDPLLLAWELTPFSFVFDWFIDVGTWLEQASSLQGWTVLAGYSSLKQTFDGSQKWENLYVDGSRPGYLATGSTHVPMKQTFYSRSAWSGSGPSIKAPLWDALNARRLTTSAALWKQRCQGDRLPGKYKP